MTPPETLTDHLQLCDELHHLAIEENRFLKQHQRAPEDILVEKRRELLARLETSLQAIKSPDTTRVPTDPDERARRAESIEKARARILQILHLQKENEQLLLRYSLGASRPAPMAAPPPVAHLQKLYDKHPR